MTPEKIVTRKEWLAERRALLEKEKAHTRIKDELTTMRQALPWVLLDKEYSFESDQGSITMDALFGAHDQLIIYHFMFGPSWETGCASCSFWADSFNGLAPHLAARGTAFTAVSSAPMTMISPFKKRMGWEFNWVSSSVNTFNADYNVGFMPDQPTGAPLMYNFKEIKRALMDEMHGTSVFAKSDDGAIYHTYSTYGRGLEITNAAYSYLDMTPRGRDEPPEGNPMAWVRHRDNY